MIFKILAGLFLVRVLYRLLKILNRVFFIKRRIARFISLSVYIPSLGMVTGFECVILADIIQALQM